jgi:hypothetical protein
MSVTQTRDVTHECIRNGKPAAKAARQLRLAILAILMAILDFAFFLQNCSHQSAIRLSR